MNWRNFLTTIVAQYKNFNWQSIKTEIIRQLKGAAVKAALLKFLGTATGVGFKAWLIKKIVTEFSEEIGEPVVRGMLNNAGWIYEKINGNLDIRRANKAEEEGNQPEYDDAIDDVYS